MTGLLSLLARQWVLRCSLGANAAARFLLRGARSASRPWTVSSYSLQAGLAVRIAARNLECILLPGPVAGARLPGRTAQSVNTSRSHWNLRREAGAIVKSELR